MHCAPDRWELGSQPQWLDFEPRTGADPRPWEAQGALYGCGRDALRALVEHQRWKRVWLPTYLCQEVVASVLACGVDVALYPDDPTQKAPSFATIPDRAGEAVVLVNYFGLRRAADQPRLRHASLVEDHTHAPVSVWAQRSQADFAFASLRKLLPLPDGAALWSCRHPVPQPDDSVEPRGLAGQARLGGFLLKSLYLRGYDVDKETFRALFDAGERLMGEGPSRPISPLSRQLLHVFPLGTWAAHRRRLFHHALGRVSSVTVLRPREADAVPFGLAVVFATADERDRVRRELLAQRIYPSALWPLEKPCLPGVRASDQDLARRMVLLPCDVRYDDDDLDRAVSHLERAVRSL